MEYNFTSWTIDDLYRQFADRNLDISPAYQRNAVWSVRAQKKLINTIQAKQPLPTFFIRRLDGGSFEVVDGQQRIRSIFAYKCGDITDESGTPYNSLQPEDRAAFDSYRLNITHIFNLAPHESIERYYALVNSSGMRVNRPEIFKAEYHNTRFLRLVTEMAILPCFSDLRLFTSAKESRMEDMDFVSELLSLILHGITDKKDAVDDIFRRDITSQQHVELDRKFRAIIAHFSRYNERIPLYRTRYRQKNDFYTLFGFLHDNDGLPNTVSDYYFDVLMAIAPYISPSQDDCDPLKHYAQNCVTQSNSKVARLERLEFLNQLFLNDEPSPNETQQDLMHFFNMSESALFECNHRFTLDVTKISDPYCFELSL